MINSILKKYRRKIALYHLIKNSSIAICIILITINVFSLIEEIFYLNQNYREKLFYLLLSIAISLSIYAALHWIICHFKLLNNFNDIVLSKKIGQEHSIIKDDLTNIIQIQKINDSNKSLVDLAIKNVNIKLEKIVNKLNSFILPKKHLYCTACIIIISLIAMSFFKIQQPIYRIINYDQKFSAPLPFNLFSDSGTFSALEGDSIYIKITGMGELPDSIMLYTNNNNEVEKYKLPKINNQYQHLLLNQDNDVIYWGEYINELFFSNWSIISTNKDTIQIKNRPKFMQTNFLIKPPAYTKKKSFVHNKNNVTQIEILEGSEVSLSILSNKNLKTAWMLDSDDKRTDMNIKDKNIIHTFILDKNMKFSIFCLDENYISNINPTQYTLIAKKDIKPQLIIRSPQENFELDESYNVKINTNIIDDLGISKVWIEHSIFNPDFPDFNDKKDTTIIYFDGESQKTNLLVNYNWDISKMNLLMGDELHFHILVQDNNMIKNNIAKFPSLENIFSQIESNQEETENIIENIQESIENITEITDDMRLDLLKSDDISWEEKQKLDNTFEEIEQIKEQIKSIENTMEKVIENAEANNLFDKNLSEKIEHLQDILKNIMSPELMEAIQKLQEAMQKNDMKKIMESLEDYEFNIEKMEEQLDRFIDMFELALAEQKLNEVSKYLEDMINKQNQLIENIEDNESAEYLNKKSIKQKNRFNNLETLLYEAGSLVEDISNSTFTEINNLLNDNIISDTKQELDKQSNEIVNLNKKSSSEAANNINENFNDIYDIVNEIKKQFNDESKEKLSKEFISIINSMITISNQQESINYETKGLRSNSPKIKTLNKMQYNIDQELIQITAQIIDLSNKTFFINPKINRYIGQLKTSIKKCISFFEQKQINNGKKEQSNILININTITSLLLESMNEMKNSDMTSGFEEFMESLHEISEGQKQVNQGTMKMGMGMYSIQQMMMQELQKQQEELKEKLEELLGNNPGEDQGGGLHQTKEEMDEIISDFINKNVTKKTIERQQRILSRLLDSQKSLQQKDYDKKRESNTAENFEYLGPLGLPNDLGEKDILLMKALESAINENLPEEYNSLIQTYFLKMQNDKESNEN